MELFSILMFEPSVLKTTLLRSTTPLGSSSAYPPTIPSTGYEGGSGFLSGDAHLSAWANWSVAYLKYCDGGSWTGTRREPVPAGNSSHGPLWYRGHHNLWAQLGTLATAKGVGAFEEILLAGCSAGGLACYLHCDRVAEFFGGRRVKCSA